MNELRHQHGFLGKLDAVLHLLRVPHRLMRPICDRYENTKGGEMATKTKKKGKKGC